MLRNVPAWWIASILGWAFLLFAQLGHYALWDDEALTALSAKAVQATGDTGVLLEHHNIVAYRDALCVHDFADRSTPPLSAYLCALSFDIFGWSAFSARLPFALLGMGTATLLLIWIREVAAPGRWVLLAALFGNVSLILFIKQCRYYSPAIFFTIAIVFVAWRWRQSRGHYLILAALSICLFAANPMNCVALYAVLGVDYLLWRRKEQPLSWGDSAALFLPQILADGAIAAIWNPFRTAFGGYENSNSLLDRLTLFFWTWRDLDRSEFFALPLLATALVIGIYFHRSWMVRGCVALLIYVVAITAVSPQRVSESMEAEARYLTPILPLAIALQAAALTLSFGSRGWLLGAAAAVAFGTNLLNGGPLLPWGTRCSLVDYLGELSLPQAEPYTPTATWINAHIPADSTVWVNPYYATYPLMFAAPNVTYGWQLTWPPRRDLASLPAIDFGGRLAPDYIVAFGPAQKAVYGIQAQKVLPGFDYELVNSIPVYWKDMYRPELYWRQFETLRNFNPERDGVYIFKKSSLP